MHTNKLLYGVRSHYHIRTEIMWYKFFFSIFYNGLSRWCLWHKGPNMQLFNIHKRNLFANKENCVYWKTLSWFHIRKYNGIPHIKIIWTRRESPQTAMLNWTLLSQWFLPTARKKLLVLDSNVGQFIDTFFF